MQVFSRGIEAPELHHRRQSSQLPGVDPVFHALILTGAGGVVFIVIRSS